MLSLNKKNLTLMVGPILLIFLTIYLYNKTPNIIISTDSAGNTITEYPQEQILLISPNNNTLGTVQFFSGWNTGSWLIQNSWYHIVINGWYFWYTNTAKTWFIAAGPVQTSKEGYTKMLSLSDLIDPNLTHTILFQHNNKKIQFSPLSTSGIQNYRMLSGEQIFVAGPMIIDHNNITTEATTKKNHRQEKFPRTVLIYDHSHNKVYYLISIQEKTLQEIAWYIREFQHTYKIFASMKDNNHGNSIGKNGQKQSQQLGIISAINLDGGPSTMITSKEFPQYNYHSDILLPFFITL